MTIEQHLAEALREVRMRNARRINWIRGAGALSFLLIICYMAFVRHEEDWWTTFVPVLVYFAFALGLLVAGEFSPAVLKASRFAVPVFDMPMVFAIQLVNLQTANVPGHVTEFSIALFVCLLMLSAFTLNSSQIVISLVLAIVFQEILQEVAGMSVGARLNSIIVFCIATWMCAFAGRNRLRLVKTVTQADARRMRLQRYFSPGVGEILEKQEEDKLAEGRDCELTVLFADIRGFTKMSERLDSRQVIQLLNSYHATMVEAVFQHGGTLDKYLGDGLMAYFNAPIGQPDHADRAVRCALAMEGGLRDLNAIRAREGAPPIRMGIGIHTGRAIVGDIGAPERREFTAIGHAVNLTSVVEEKTKEFGVSILISEATIEHLSEPVRCRVVGDLPESGDGKPLSLLTPETSEGGGNDGVEIAAAPG